jgi:hypothetical protein
MITTVGLVFLVVAMLVVLASVKKRPPSPPATQIQSLASSLGISHSPAVELRRMTAREESELEAMEVVRNWYRKSKDERFKKEVLADLGEMILSQATS